MTELVWFPGAFPNSKDPQRPPIDIDWISDATVWLQPSQYSVSEKRFNYPAAYEFCKISTIPVVHAHLSEDVAS